VHNIGKKGKSTVSRHHNRPTLCFITLCLFLSAAALSSVHILFGRKHIKSNSGPVFIMQ